MEILTTASSKESPEMKVNTDFNGDEHDSELELGLGLSLGGGGCGGGGVKFLTAQDLPSVAPHGHGCSLRSQPQVRPFGAISGTKRAADLDVSSSSPPASSSQVVGWPPIRTYRMNNLVNQTRATKPENVTTNIECGNKKMNNGNDSKTKTPAVQETTHPHLGFVKVNMDGVQIGRKIDLNAHSSYESLAQTIEEMFFRPGGEKDQQGKTSKLLDGSSEFVLTYEDKEGDWMLVGDVPFRMFLGTVRRLRIMRTSEANGLAPRSLERNERPRSKPV